MRASVKTAISFILVLSMLLGCLACSGGGAIEPFTRPPSTAAPDSTGSPNSSPSSNVTPEAAQPAVSLKNELGSELIELYISSSDLSSWGEPILYEIGSGEEVELRFAEFGGAPGELYDIGTIDENGVNYDCYDVVLIAGDSITLSENGEEAEFLIERADGSREVFEAVVYSDEPGESKRSAFIEPYISLASDYSYDSQSETVYAVYSSSSVRLNPKDEERFPLLSSALNAVEKKRSEASLEAYYEFAERAHQALNEQLEERPAASFADEAFVRMAEESAFSILYARSETLGGESRREFSAVNFDPQTGAQLMLSDCARDIQALQSSIYIELEKAYGGIPFDEDAELITEFSAPSDKLVWLLEPSGLSVMIKGAPFGGEDTYYSVFLPYSAYPDLVNERYLPKSENYASAFPLEFDNKAVIEGKSSTVSVASLLGEEALIRVRYNGAEFDFEYADAYEVAARFVHANGRDLIYLDMLSDNDNRFLSVLSLEDDAVVRLGEFLGSWGYTYERTALGLAKLIQPMVDPESFTLYSKTMLLGTADGTKQYSIGSNGLPQTEDAYFYIISPDIELELKQPIELHLVSESGDIDVATVELASGSTLVYFRTDGVRFADLSMEDGRFVRTVIDDGRIDSIPIAELFEGIVYSG